MPKVLKKKLYKRAKKKFPGNKKLQDRYVYGTLNKLNNGGAVPKKRMFSAIDGSKHPTAEQRDGYNKSLKQARIELAKEKAQKDFNMITRGEDPASRVFREAGLLYLTGGAGNFILSKARYAKTIPKVQKLIRRVDNISDAKEFAQSLNPKVK